MDGMAEHFSIDVEKLPRGAWLLSPAEERWPIRCMRFLSFGKIAPHGCLIVFHNEAAGLRGAMVNWRNGEERPLASLRVDGSVLEFQMEPGTPIFRMTLTHKLEGYSFSANGEAPGPKVKMIEYDGPYHR